MFRSRRRLAAAAAFWVAMLGAAFGISLVPGATAADTPTSSGMTLRQHVTQFGSAATRATDLTGRSRPRYVKVLDSTDATPHGLGGASNHCTLNRSGLGDTFILEESSDRCTWVNTHFSHMHRHEVFVISVRFDSRPTEHDDGWENVFTFRPTGFPPVFGNTNCPGDPADGNAHVMLLNLYVNRRPSPNRWQLDIRGGKSVNLSDEVVKRLKLGPIVVGKTLTLKFDIVTDYLHGAATVWKDGKRIYKNRDRPLGFHYDCDRTTDLSNFPLQMQHGVYRSGGGAVTLSSSGFKFRLSRRVPSRDS